MGVGGGEGNKKIYARKSARKEIHARRNPKKNNHANGWGI